MIKKNSRDQDDIIDQSSMTIFIGQILISTKEINENERQIQRLQ